MPFLWDRIKQLLTSKKSPSPKHRILSRFRDSIERVSLLSSLKDRLAASMTVEAALVLPLFLFFFINLTSAIEMIRLHDRLQLALWNVGNRMCVYGYAADQADYIRQEVTKRTRQTEKTWWYELADVALSYTYIKQKVVDYAGEDYLEGSPLSYGCSGLQFWESDLFVAADASEASRDALTGDVIDIVMTYQVSPPLRIPTVIPFRMVNRYYGHRWTGYDISGEHSQESNARDMVYVTENASVYHESMECTHLKLSVREVSMEEALGSRNASGSRYRECSKCGKQPFQGTVFITSEGDFYHYERECSGLKRTVRAITREEASGYRPCSRCAAK